MNFTKLSFATWMLVIATSCFASQDSVKVVKGQVSDYYIPVVNEYELTGIVTDEHDQPLERPSSFANDEEMLDYIEKTHLNYMWDGANPNSGLAPERIHLDGIYPQNDKHVVTTGGSGFGIAGLLAGLTLFTLVGCSGGSKADSSTPKDYSQIIHDARSDEDNKYEMIFTKGEDGKFTAQYGYSAEYEADQLSDEVANMMMALGR